jgi:hypothetical protein
MDGEASLLPSGSDNGGYVCGLRVQLWVIDLAGLAALKRPNVFASVDTAERVTEPERADAPGFSAHKDIRMPVGIVLQVALCVSPEQRH